MENISYETKIKLPLEIDFDFFLQYLDRSPAILTSDDFIRSNEIIRTKWSINVESGHFVLTI